MLAYSANRPTPVSRTASPNSMLAIIGVHVAALAAVMSARMDLPIPTPKTPLTVDFIKPKPIPPEPPVEAPDKPAPRPDRSLSLADPIVPLPPMPDVVPVPDSLPPAHGPTGAGTTGPTIGPSTDVSKPIAATPAVLLTGAAELKPPYPASKLASGEEADLKLRLTIDERGRVIGVDPLGRADPAFLSAARRHIMSHWRYRPATSDGRGVIATLVITLRFRLDE